MIVRSFLLLILIEIVKGSWNFHDDQEFTKTIVKTPGSQSKNQRSRENKFNMGAEGKEPKFNIVNFPDTDSLNIGDISYDHAYNAIYLLAYQIINDGKLNESKLFIRSGLGKDIVLVDLTYESKKLMFNKIFVSSGIAIAMDNRNMVAAMTTDRGDHWNFYYFGMEMKNFIFHPVDHAFIAGLGSYGYLFISTDNGIKWKMKDYGVNEAVWSPLSKYIYYMKSSQYGSSNNMLYRENTESNGYPEFLLDDVIELGRKDTVISTVVKHKNKSQKLYISVKDSDFKEAIFPHYLKPINLKIHSVLNEEIFVVVINETKKAMLYTGLLEDLKFKRTKDDIGQYLYYEHESCYSVETFRELPGIAITQLKKNGEIQDNYFSAISFDHGNKWSHVLYDNILDGKECKWPICYLQLTLECKKIINKRKMLSVPRAPTLIVSHGRYFIDNRSQKESLFISTDAGLSWHKALDRGHDFTILNDGSAILAFPKFSYEAYYSYDFGLTWSSFPLTNHKFIPLLVLHDTTGDSLIAVTVGFDEDDFNFKVIETDFREVLKEDCKADDYDLFTPGTGRREDCFQGKKNVFYKRKHNVTCKSIISKLPVPESTICPCNENDFGCNFGYFLSYGKCRKDPDLIIEKPEKCKIGEFVITPTDRGKLHGDVCRDNDIKNIEHADICNFTVTDDTLSIYSGNLFKFVNLKNENIQQMTTLPIFTESEHQIVSFTVDHFGKCVYYSNSSGIFVACWRTKEEAFYNYEKLYINKKDIIGLNFDMFGRNLYYYDEMSIFVVQVDTNYKKLLISSKTKIYYFSILAHNIYLAYSTVKISNNMKLYDIYFGKMNGEIIHSITINERVTSITYDGAKYIIIFTETRLFEMDLKTHSMEEIQKSKSNILVAELTNKKKYYITNNSIILGSQTIHHHQIVDGEIYFEHDRGDNPCLVSHCSHFCYPLPENSYLCGCPDSMVVDDAHGCKCSPDDPNCDDCKKNEFKCDNKKCLDMAVRCNGVNDCGDESDEKDCKYSCTKDELQCGDGITCVNVVKICDGFIDCPDGLDEIHCQNDTCKTEEFKCFNNKCIPWAKYCDGFNDCGDYSDEDSCQIKNCKPYEATCKNGQCILPIQVCNGIFDCKDWSDELNCEGKYSNSTDPNCVLRCDEKCIEASKICNHFTDCKEKQDESNCPRYFKCPQDNEIKCKDDTACYNPKKKCDGFNDCTDGSDEFQCKNPINHCDHIDNFKCDSDDKCINMNMYCDGKKDCEDNSDESKDCHDQIRVNEISILSRGFNQISIEWKLNRKERNTKYSVTVQNWEKKKVIQSYSTESKNYTIQKLNDCEFYTVTVTILGDFVGRSLQFVSKPDNVGIPTDLSYSNRTQTLSWIHSKSKCATSAFFVACYTDNILQLKNFTYDNSLKIPFNSKYNCKVSSCPSSVFNISCSDFSTGYKLINHAASNTFLKVGLPIIIVLIIVCGLTIGIFYLKKTGRLNDITRKLGLHKFNFMEKYIRPTNENASLMANEFDEETL